MADMNFEEDCPCGASVKFSGYSSEVRIQIQSWRSVHKRHADNIAKAVAENKTHPAYYVWPSTTGTNITFDTGTPSTTAKKVEEL